MTIAAASYEPSTLTGIQRAAEPAGASSEQLPTEPSLEDVVSRLYDRISGRLRAELLIDRERAGALTDLR